MNKMLVLLSLISLFIVGFSNGDDDKKEQKKRELRPFYDALISQGLDSNDGDNDKLNKLMNFLDDKFEFCQLDRCGNALSQCQSKDSFKNGIMEKRADGTYEYDLVIESMSDGFVSLECEFVFRDNNNKYTIEKQNDKIYYDKNGKIKMLEVRYMDNNDDVKCNDDGDSVYGEGEKEKKKKDLSDFYQIAKDCGLKMYGSDDTKLDDMMKYFSDNIRFCSSDGNDMRLENKNCYVGKDAVTKMMKDTYYGKFERIGYEINIKKNEKDYAEIECQFEFEDDYGCKTVTTETDKIYYDKNGKIEMFDSRDITVDKIECDDKKDTDSKHVKPAPMYRQYVTSKSSDSNNNKPSTTKDKDKEYGNNKASSPMYREYASKSVYSKQEMYGEEEKEKKKKEVSNFYEVGINCLKKDGLDDTKLDDIMKYFSDDIELCSVDGNNINNMENKQCYKNKDAVRKMMKETYCGKYKNVAYMIDITKNEKDYVELKCEWQFEDDYGCISVVTETDKIYYDTNGKINRLDADDIKMNKLECDNDNKWYRKDLSSKSKHSVESYDDHKVTTTKAASKSIDSKNKYYPEPSSTNNKDTMYKEYKTMDEYREQYGKYENNKPSVPKSVDYDNNNYHSKPSTTKYKDVEHGDDAMYKYQTMDEYREKYGNNKQSTTESTDKYYPPSTTKERVKKAPMYRTYSSSNSVDSYYETKKKEDRMNEYRYFSSKSVDSKKDKKENGYYSKPTTTTMYRNEERNRYEHDDKIPPVTPRFY